MDWNSVLVVFSIFNEWGEIVTLDAFWWLLLTRYQGTATSSTDWANFGTPSLSSFWSSSFFVLPNNFIVSGDNNSNLWPVFILKAILFLILLV